MEEEWKEIEGYPHYQVSNTGKVRSNMKPGGGAGDNYDEYHEIKTWHIPIGYEYVTLHKEGEKKKNFSMHRLVAKAFVPNPDPENKTQVNHIDENRGNNNADNLNWLTPGENDAWGNHSLRESEAHKGLHPSEETRRKMSEARMGRTLSEESRQKLSDSKIAMNNKGKGVIQYDSNGNEIARYKSQSEASRQTGDSKSYISSSCRGVAGDKLDSYYRFSGLNGVDAI